MQSHYYQQSDNERGGSEGSDTERGFGELHWGGVIGPCVLSDNEEVDLRGVILKEDWVCYSDLSHLQMHTDKCCPQVMVEAGGLHFLGLITQITNPPRFQSAHIECYLQHLSCFDTLHLVFTPFPLCSTTL